MCVQLELSLLGKLTINFRINLHVQGKTLPNNQKIYPFTRYSCVNKIGMATATKNV